MSETEKGKPCKRKAASDMQTKKLRFLFREAKIDGHATDNVISTTTKLRAILYGEWDTLKYNFSHVELWESDENNEFSHTDDFGDTQYDGCCYSSTTRGGAKGVRRYWANKVLRNPKNWKQIEVEVPLGLWLYAKRWFQKQIGKGYDWTGAVGCVLWQRENPLLWFCSEICTKMAVMMFLLKCRVFAITPRKLAAKLARKYGDPKGLE